MGGRALEGAEGMRKKGREPNSWTQTTVWGLSGDREWVEVENNGREQPSLGILPHRVALQPAALHIPAFSPVSATAQLLEHRPANSPSKRAGLARGLLLGGLPAKRSRHVLKQ